MQRDTASTAATVDSLTQAMHRLQADMAAQAKAGEEHAGEVRALRAALADKEAEVRGSMCALCALCLVAARGCCCACGCVCMHDRIVSALGVGEWRLCVSCGQVAGLVDAAKKLRSQLARLQARAHTQLLHVRPLVCAGCAVDVLRACVCP